MALVGSASTEQVKMNGKDGIWSELLVLAATCATDPFRTLEQRKCQPRCGNVPIKDVSDPTFQLYRTCFILP